MKLNFYDWCLQNNRHDLLDRWDYELNKKSPKNVLYNDNNKFYFKCTKNIDHNSSPVKLCNLIRKKTPLECAECNSFAQWCKDNIENEFIEKYWDSNKNIGINPWEISAKSKKTIYLKCNNGYEHTYSITPRGFLIGAHSCSICQGKEVIVGFNDLFTSNPELKELWNFDKNKDISPYDITRGTAKKAWWKCSICGNEWNAYVSNVVKGHRCPKCAAKLIGDFHRKTSDEFLKQVESCNKNLIILEDYKNSSTKILCRCSIDGYEWEAWPDHLVRGSGCPVCANKHIVPGINDVATTHKDVVKYFKDRHKALEYSHNSNVRIDAVCPECGYEKNILLQHLTRTGFACPICNDGISYPNKYCRYFLKQLPILNFQCEWQPDWAKPYFYDNYFEYNEQKYILEADGLQHYETSGSKWANIDETRERDRIKNYLAEQNGIHMIRIDCRHSYSDYISKNILNSELNKIFDLSNINWDYCDSMSHKSLVKQVCDLYNTSENKTLKNISEIFNLSPPTVRSYLKKGNTLGWCNYTSISF